MRSWNINVNLFKIISVLGKEKKMTQDYNEGQVYLFRRQCGSIPRAHPLNLNSPTQLQPIIWQRYRVSIATDSLSSPMNSHYPFTPKHYCLLQWPLPQYSVQHVREGEGIFRPFRRAGKGEVSVDTSSSCVIITPYGNKIRLFFEKRNHGTGFILRKLIYFVNILAKKICCVVVAVQMGGFPPQYTSPVSYNNLFINFIMPIIMNVSFT